MPPTPHAQGLYRPEFEHDACGVSFVVDLHGRATHEIVRMGVEALCNLEHRGATGAEPNTGDGTGILVQVPDAFLRAVVGFPLPAAGRYAVGTAFLPADPELADAAAKAIHAIVDDEGLEVLGWRDVPTDPATLGSMARAVMPSFRQVFIAGRDADGEYLGGIDLDRRAFPLRKRCEAEITLADPDDEGIEHGVYFPSLSARTLVYKGMLTTPQLTAFYPELEDPRMASALVMVHSRFSTNTFPSWPLAHPYRLVAHNGEINTIMGNRNRMRAREAGIATPALEGDLERLYPVCTPGASDTATFDEALELLHLGGYPLPHAVLMMIPEAWENHESMAPEKAAFYRFHSALMEPWDGPASIAFTDGTVIGAVLDRNGLRPSRYWVTEDGLVITASEAGVLPIDPARVVRKGRLEPGRMLLVDTSQGRLIPDEEIKASLAAAHPYQQWLDQAAISFEDLPAHAELAPGDATHPDEGTLVTRQLEFGYTLEDLGILIEPMGSSGGEAIGSMGTDTPIAVLSSRSRLLYDYFSQLFAQVTNPPLDALREELVTSLFTRLGASGNVFDPGPWSARQLELRTPILTTAQLHRVRHANDDGELPELASRTISGLFPVAEGGAALRDALDRVRAEAATAARQGARVLVLSDRGATPQHAPIPALLLVSAVHHHLIRERIRSDVGLIVETGEAREVHHFCLLVGYGATAVNPYLALDTVRDLCARGRLRTGDPEVAEKNYVKAAGKGLLKVMSKMGISTVASYTGAQVFEAVGLGQDLVDEFFVGTTSRLGGIGLDRLATEVAMRHHVAHPPNPLHLAHRELPGGGEYQWRREGEYHLFNPETVFKLQHSTRAKPTRSSRSYSGLVDRQARQLATLRGLFRFRAEDRTPVPIDEVEPVSAIVKRFATGAMSYGSISAEAHETLAIAMNRLGGKSNTGEGGEDPARFVADPNGDWRRSAVKQVASGRFGVTSEYLVNADDLQIKMAQGAKPGEGGQLPGHKVYPWIAKTRHSTPGVGLISPPPHHDIYSIEDLAQLIHDLKNANPEARVHVKLVAEVGVGTVAAGVAKAHSDVVLISGHDGGTGAAPLTSLKHAGAPWELGLAETQQTLLLNRLRDRIVVQVDGQLKTGRDVVVAALLGAEEFGFATAPLVVSGCIMMRVCHLDTCPVGVATQNPELRQRFTGKAEFVVNFFEFVAEEVRELLADLGFRSLDEAIGRADVLDVTEAVDHWKAAGLDLRPILYVPPLEEGADRHCTTTQDHSLDKALDNTLIELARPALEHGEPVVIRLPVSNTNRTLGTMLGYHLTKRHGAAGLADDTITVQLEGSAGNSLGAFLPRGITLRVEGDTNDYVGKGLSGGRIVVRPHRAATFAAEENIVAGNVGLYGATGGEMFLRGVVGERFCVRNSGATAVVEGVGDHGCEYMTGGRVVVLGSTGRNFGAGMSGGAAFVHDADGTFPARVNPEMVDLDPLDEEDREFVQTWVRRHYEETESTVAERLLGDWPTEAARFVKVMPKDYKRVLAAEQAARERGDDVIDAIMAAAHG
ncbi:MAG: glutamate synthase large subunit [Acidimicrobiia bacterium]|nr:glutamate synthase large subunit [Acidimicrobiia bacterium]